MQIFFTKEKGNYDTLTFSKNDGSMSQMILKRGMIEHDLLHFAVESTLAITNGFFGLLSKGHQIEELSKLKKGGIDISDAPSIPNEAFQVEFIVGLLQMEQAENKTYDNFLEILRDICESRKTDFPERLDEVSLKAIRQKSKTFLRQWQSLNPGGTIEVTFDLL